MIHKLERTQQIHCNIEEAWRFFSSANNLAVITPKEMNFTVISKLENDEIYEGMLIDYTVSPVLQIPMRWQTEITQVAFQRSFTDFQKIGPYKLWNHFHEFIPNEDGVLIKDTVTYELPMGFLGEIAHKLFVKNKLKNIFDFRHEVLEVMFNQKRKSS